MEDIPSVPFIQYSVTQAYPHDTSLFTEGLLFHNGKMYESTGSPAELPHIRSLIGVTDIPSGAFTKKIEIDRSQYFGEGIVFLKDKLYQLTYKNQLGFIYDAKSFKQIGKFSYANKEGWGMTTDGTHLILSDGTDALTYLDPAGLTPAKSLRVTENGIVRDKLNELEFIKGFIYANVWGSNFIVKIDPSDGHVIGKIDLSSIVNEAAIRNPNGDVLNGIAYDAATDKIYVTGKMWANIYEIAFEH
jgi:glutamine cyclotransferase